MPSAAPASASEMQPPEPPAGSIRYFVLLYTPQARRRALASLLALADEIGAEMCIRDRRLELLDDLALLESGEPVEPHVEHGLRLLLAQMIAIGLQPTVGREPIRPRDQRIGPLQ